MKKIMLFTSLFALFAFIAQAQALDSTAAFAKNSHFTGATPTVNMYHAIYQFDSNDPKLIEKGIRNINNALKDARLAGKLEIELVSFGPGTEIVLKGGKYEQDLKALVAKGVIVAQCNNSLVERKIAKDQIYDFIAVVPSGNGELILRQAEGWSVVKP